ncbi:hypothetical protein BH11MYX3_BH11MYX3_27760 [soil metagenome]
MHDLTELLARGPIPFAGRYVLGEVLGSGGMGTVYSALQLSLGRQVAIKIPHAELAADPFVVSRFRAEALAGGRLAHRNVARVIDFGNADGALFLVMELVPGVALDTTIAEDGPVEMRVAIDLCGQLLAALEAAHAAGIIHADIKSGNLLVETRPDSSHVVRVIDFGLAQFSSESSDVAHRMISGTPDYLAPEVIEGGGPTVASDIYAAGVVLYEMLTGTTPFCGGTAEQILQRQLDDAVVPPTLRCPEQGISSAVEAVVMHALAKRPEDRFATAAAFAEALRIAATAPSTRNPRVARGTHLRVSHAPNVTQDWHREQASVPVVQAVPSGGKEAVRLQRIRFALGEALAGKHDDQIVASYLELVRALVDARQLTTAVAELEHGLVLLRERTVPSAIWRLQLCLAALYSGLGDATRARRAASIGQSDAIHADSLLGQDRAGELLLRLARAA